MLGRTNTANAFLGMLVAWVVAAVLWLLNMSRPAVWVSALGTGLFLVRYFSISLYRAKLRRNASGRKSDNGPMKTELTVRNCPLFKWRCSQTWEVLTPTGDARTRYCDQCQREVHYCVSDAETIDHAKAGHCIAREMPSDSELPDLYVGEPSEELIQWTENEQRAMDWAGRERGIDDSIKNADAARSCPQCGYPAPTWRTDCRVCGFEIGRA